MTDDIDPATLEKWERTAPLIQNIGYGPGAEDVARLIAAYREALRDRDHALAMAEGANGFCADAERERDEALAALRPFAGRYLYPDDHGPEFAAELRAEPDWNEASNDEQADDLWIKRGWIRAARAALKGAP